MKNALTRFTAFMLVTGMLTACSSIDVDSHISAPSRQIFSPYKYVRNNMASNQNQLIIGVTGKSMPLLDAIPKKLKTITLAFATGECGEENWDGLPGEVFAEANVPLLAKKEINYIISTGGQAGSFTCSSDAGFKKFIERYHSAQLSGFDFDIEASQTEEQINQLIKRIKLAQTAYPHLRFSFTLPTLAIINKPALGAIGLTVMQSIKKADLHDYYINLMVMDYGVSSTDACVLGADARCDMGASAIQAAINLHHYFGVPFDHIELTPMIGGNDTEDEVFNLNDIATMTLFAQKNHLAGLHFWSLDRDVDCPPGPASPDCNSYGKAGLFGFTNAFLK
ncbi:glycosyl hydrolase [Undibacterium sp. Ji67W]|uniref:glycosyl hydrolase n=1 Tax=Undibacterium sp. Ji67W TaxID=3413042 RepID=UPI003BF39C1C